MQICCRKLTYTCALVATSVLVALSSHTLEKPHLSKTPFLRTPETALKPCIYIICAYIYIYTEFCAKTLAPYWTQTYLWDLWQFIPAVQSRSLLASLALLQAVRRVSAPVFSQQNQCLSLGFTYFLLGVPIAKFTSSRSHARGGGSTLNV